MKKRFRLASVVAVCACCLLPSRLPAQFSSDSFYLKFDLGGNYTPDTNLREFFGPVTAGAEVSFDPGFRAGFGAGYEWVEWFATELQFGVMGNNIDGIDGAQFVDAYLVQAPIFVNGKLQWKNRSRFTPYIGGGVGASVFSLNLDHVDFGPIHVHGTEQDAVFAYQGFGGIRFEISQSLGLSVEYRYIGAQAPTFDGHDDRPFPGLGSDTVAFGRIETHAVSLAVDLRF